MKKSYKFLSILLAIVLLIGMLPAAVFAEDGCTHTNAVFYDFEGTASSCFEPGVGGYWFCEDCSQYLDESKENGYWEELLASKIPATGHAFNADTGYCDNCGLENPIYYKVTSMADINEEDMYIFVANVGDRYFVLGGLNESAGDEQGNVWGHEDGNAIEVTPYEDGSISLLNQNYVGTMKPSEFMLDVNPDQWNFTENGLTTVMPLLPNYCVFSFQSYDLHNTGYMGVPRYADGMYGMWDGSAWAIDFYTTEVDENTYRDDMDGYTHAEQVARGNIDDNIAEGDLLMYSASFYSVGGAMFTLRFREYVNEDDVTEYYFICGEDGYLVGSEGWDSVTDTTPTNDIQYAISLYRYDVTSTPTHTCDFGDWVADTDSDTHTRTCKDAECGKTETKSHNWDNGEETKAPTCTENGEKTFTCSDCKATKTEAIDALNHDWSTWSDNGANAATDTHTHTCQRDNCGEKEQLSHDWGKWTPDGDTNHTKTCSVCSGTRTATHSWNEGVITTQPTEEEEGIKTYTCTDCGHTKTEPVDKLEHVHIWSDWGQNNETTHIRSCRCNETQTENHNFDDGVVTEPPTHTEEGIKTFTCTDCGATKDEKIDKTPDHEFGDWTIDETTENKHYRECACGENETKNCNYNDGKVILGPSDFADNDVIIYYCNDCGRQMIIDYTATDNITHEEEKVSVSVPEGSTAVIDSTTVLQVEKTDEAVSNTAQENIEQEIGDNAEALATYDISMLLNGAEIQPGGDVEVNIPLPQNINAADYTDITVVYIDDNGNVTPCETTVNDDGTVTFVTDHFSCYSIVAVPKVVNEPTVNPTPDTNKPSTEQQSPQTSDNTVFALAALMFVSGFSTFAFCKKRTSKR